MNVLEALRSIYPTVQATVYQFGDNFTQTSQVVFTATEVPKQTGKSQGASVFPITIKSLAPSGQSVTATTVFEPHDQTCVKVAEVPPNVPAWNVREIIHSGIVQAGVFYESDLSLYACSCQTCRDQAGAQVGITSLTVDPRLPAYSATYVTFVDPVLPGSAASAIPK